MIIKSLILDNVCLYSQRTEFSLEPKKSSITNRPIILIGGRNGAGKTTTIRHLMGFSKPHEGELSINGKDCWKAAAIIKYDDPSQKLNSMDLRIVSFISDNYKRAYHCQAEGKTEAEKLYLRILLVTDYICGMTDSYAMRLYQEMRGMFLSGTE